MSDCAECGKEIVIIESVGTAHLCVMCARRVLGYADLHPVEWNGSLLTPAWHSLVYEDTLRTASQASASRALYPVTDALDTVKRSLAPGRPRRPLKVGQYEPTWMPVPETNVDALFADWRALLVRIICETCRIPKEFLTNG